MWSECLFVFFFVANNKTESILKIVMIGVSVILLDCMNYMLMPLHISMAKQINDRINIRLPCEMTIHRRTNKCSGQKNTKDDEIDHTQTQKDAHR